MARAKAKKDAAAKKRSEQGLAAVVREGGNKSKGPKINVKKPVDNAPSKKRSIGPSDRFVKWMEDAAKEIYTERRKVLPTVNIIGYSILKEEGNKTLNILSILR